ncbi:hypothetical protein KP509_35G064900 [Ceratopteris richardii]|nr:hypothetical protein KP509_35G064900 [Ceratopteris richardii]
MKCDGFFPDRVSFLSVLKACGNMGALEKSQEIHAQILKSGLLERDTVLATALVDVYAKCNWLERASEVFDMLNAPDIVAWNTLITGYACLEYGKKALHYFDQLLSTSLSPNAITFSAALKACATLGAIERGQKIHAEVVKEGLFLKNDTVVDNTLVYMYAKCGLVSKAQELFDELPIRNTVTWNALIAGYTQNGQSEKALHLFDEMQLEGLPPDAFTYSCMLKACGLEGLVGKGLTLHMEIVNGGAFDSNLVVGNALVDMYVKCGLVVEAQDVFDNLCNKNVVAWSALIVGYANHGLCGQAIDCFEQMCLKGFHPNIVTFLGVLKACGSIGDTCMGQKVHLEIIKGEKMLDRDIALGTALVDMYAKCGLLVEAEDVFDDLPHQDIVAWNALLSGYANYLHGEAALNCFEQMRSRGFSPDLVTFASVMKACGCLGAFLKGQTVHCDVVRNGFLELDLLVGNALIDMYANCGMLKEAQNAFDSLPIRDLVSWNSVITGYAQSGKYENVFKLLHRLIIEFAKPDSVTFTLVLNTCCHNGLIDKMEAFIVMMDMEYGILPTKEHYVCLVDLFSRTGNTDLAIAITKVFPIPADVLVWNSLLGACKRQGNSTLGQWASEHVLQLGKQDPGVYVSLRNYHAAEGTDYDYSELLNM